MDVDCPVPVPTPPPPPKKKQTLLDPTAFQFPNHRWIEASWSTWRHPRHFLLSTSEQQNWWGLHTDDHTFLVLINWWGLHTDDHTLLVLINWWGLLTDDHTLLVLINWWGLHTDDHTLLVLIICSACGRFTLIHSWIWLYTEHCFAVIRSCLPFYLQN